jgi:hypothetical protein
LVAPGAVELVIASTAAGGIVALAFGARVEGRFAAGEEDRADDLRSDSRTRDCASAAPPSENANSQHTDSRTTRSMDRLDGSVQSTKAARGKMDRARKKSSANSTATEGRKQHEFRRQQR